MATLIRDSFDFYGSTTEAAGLWTAFPNASFSATTRFGIGQSLVSNTAALNITLQGSFGVNASTLFVNFSHAQIAALSFGDKQTMRFFDGSTVQCSFTLNADGSIDFFRGSQTTLLGTYVSAFSGSGDWAHFQIKIVFSNTVGSFEVRKNGNFTNDFTLTGVDNCSNANEFANSIDMITTDGGAPAQLFDDMWIFDNTIVSGEPSDWIGDARAVQDMPNSDSIIALGRSAGVTNFSNVDELTNSNVDYVFGSTSGLVDEYGHAAILPIPVAILGVSVRAIALKTDAGPRTVGLRVRSGAVVTDSPGVAIGTGARTVVYDVDLNPNTGLAWTPAELAAATFGPKIVT